MLIVSLVLKFMAPGPENDLDLFKFMVLSKLNKKILLLDNVPFELKQIENKVFYIIEKYKTKFLREL